MGTLLIVVLVLLLFGGWLRWSHSKEWGYGPSSVLCVGLVVVLILELMGFIPRGF